MQRAVSIPNVGDPRQLVRYATTVEAAGWDGFFLWDHLHLQRAAALDTVDPWVTLGAVATATERLRLGALVTPLARRRVHKLAKEVVTLDHLSGGRVIVGVGLGAPADDEFGAFGDPVDARERAAILDESLEVLGPLLAGEPVVHEGAHLRLDAHLRPGCVQHPRPPVWVAGTWPHRRPLARSLRWDGYAPTAHDGGPTPPELVAEIAAALAAQGAPEGHDLVAFRSPDTASADYAEAGATWLVEQVWPTPGWLEAFAERTAAGPD